MYYKLRWRIQHSFNFKGLAETNRKRNREAKWRFNLTRSLNSAEEQQKPRDRWIQRWVLQILLDGLGSISEGFTNKLMSATKTERLIILLPKGDKSKKLIKKNCRPITLLNVVYKLASAAIANRVKSILTKQIHPDQFGFTAGRFTGNNIRLIYDVLLKVNQQKKKRKDFLS